MSSRCDMIIQTVCLDISSKINGLITWTVYLGSKDISSYILMQLAYVILIDAISAAVHLVTKAEDRMSSSCLSSGISFLIANRSSPFVVTTLEVLGTL